MVPRMGLKARPKRPGKTPADLIAEWRGRAGDSHPVHAYQREAGGVHVLVLVTGAPVEAETGLGLAVQAIIADEMRHGQDP